MGFKGTETYAADADAVFALLCDPEMITARFEAAGDTDIEVVRCKPDGDGFVVETNRTVVIDLPGFARKVLSPTNRMTQVETWDAADDDGSRNGTFTIEVPGTPVRTDGTYQLRPTPDGTTHTIKGDLSIKIPLIGKKLGAFLSGTINEAVADDLAFNKAHFE